jgi:hypothetical protein
MVRVQMIVVACTVHFANVVYEPVLLSSLLLQKFYATWTVHLIAKTVSLANIKCMSASARETLTRLRSLSKFVMMCLVLNWWQSRTQCHQQPTILLNSSRIFLLNIVQMRLQFSLGWTLTLPISLSLPAIMTISMTTTNLHKAFLRCATVAIHDPVQFQY